MQEDNLILRKMKQSELTIAIQWAANEGWCPGLDDAELFYQADPNGFFVGEVNGEIVAVGSAVVYDADYAFCGLYIVAPEHRGKGYGLALTKHRLNYCADRNVGIDGVLENEEIYQRIGYKSYYRNRRYQFSAQRSPFDSNTVKQITKDDLNDIFEYDRHCFPAKREKFLTAWITQQSGQAFLYLNNGKVCGYVVRRKLEQGYKIGPLFADNYQIAEQLLNAIQSNITGESIFLDVPEINNNALQLAESLNAEIVFTTARMYQKGLPEIDHRKVFGITTFELG
ncbi:MAG: GNAT family N-acetyltransferase [Psychromonas sp.]|nr:GNAT family N-acetyltransferase [Alteromonadales bacterium]MCP5076793.1 GNAT family N-acetyltransferase [Psychromonas sp.]